MCACSVCELVHECVHVVCVSEYVHVVCVYVVP